jgi:phytanoyl-CoA hydroxylase
MLKNNFDNLEADYNTNGFVLIRNFFSKTTIKQIKKSLVFFLNKKKFKLKGINFVGNNSKINSAHALGKWKMLKKIESNKKVKLIAKKLLKGKIKNFGSECFAKPAKVGLPSPVHQDNFYWNIDNNKGLTFWIALDKANKNNGSLFYYKTSHKLGLIKHISSYAPGSSQKISNIKILKKFKKVNTELMPGDILIHDCLVAHGSNKNNTNNSRMGLTLRFIRSDSRINFKKKKKYEKDLAQQISKLKLLNNKVH